MSGRRFAAGVSASCGVERGHRLRTAGLLIERDLVDRQADPVEADEEAESSSSGAEEKAQLGQPWAGSDGCGVRAAHFHVPRCS